MSSKRDSPVQTQMAVGALKGLLTTQRYSSLGMEGKMAAGRRAFAQTETGFVLGRELDHIENAHTVKRKLQLALNLPSEESSLTIGDKVVENDLSTVQKDSPLLLKRIHIQQRDKSGPIELLGWHSDCHDNTKKMVKEIAKAIKHGVEPVLVHGGLGGAYLFKNIRGESVAIVKPTDEEPFAPNNPKGFVGKALGQPGLKRSVRVGETGVREVAAYLLDNHFAKVPATALVKITHSIFNINDRANNSNSNRPKKNLVSKIASMQQFVHHDFDASDYGTSSFPVSAVHRIGILDIRILNTDRHGGNLLVRKLDRVGRFGTVDLIPIDHGLCLPEHLEDPYFEWIHWPQASIPFSEDELDYIKNLDPDQDCEMLRKELPMIREASLRVLIVCTIFLKEAAAYGLCLAEIGEMMTREFHCENEEPSELELVCLEARKLVASEKEQYSPRSQTVDDDIQFDIECEELNWVGGDFFTRSQSNKTQLSRLEEGTEEEGDSEDEQNDSGLNGNLANEKFLFPTVSNVSMSLNNTTLGDKHQKINGMKRETGNTSSANEPQQISASFLKLADMGNEEWAAFLEKIKEMMWPAFEKRKTVIAGQMQRQRLGTSCQF